MKLSPSQLALLALPGLAHAFTPPGFKPATSHNLTLVFEGVDAINGADVPKDACASAPDMLGTSSHLHGVYGLVMVDLDVPAGVVSDGPSTLLHWMQLGLESAPAPSTDGASASASASARDYHPLVNARGTPPDASYKPPAPPAKEPLSHRYVQVLVNLTGAPDGAVGALRDAAAEREGFDARAVLRDAGLADSVVAGNWFNVTNPGPAKGGEGLGEL